MNQHQKLDGLYFAIAEKRQEITLAFAEISKCENEDIAERAAEALIDAHEAAEMNSGGSFVPITRDKRLQKLLSKYHEISEKILGIRHEDMLRAVKDGTIHGSYVSLEDEPPLSLPNVIRDIQGTAMVIDHVLSATKIEDGNIPERITDLLENLAESASTANRLAGIKK